MKTKSKSLNIFLYLGLIALSLFMLVPFYWMVISSLKLNIGALGELQNHMEEAAPCDLLFQYRQADGHYDRNPAVHQLLCCLRFYEDTF